MSAGESVVDANGKKCRINYKSKYLVYTEIQKPIIRDLVKTGNSSRFARIPSIRFQTVSDRFFVIKVEIQSDEVSDH